MHNSHQPLTDTSLSSDEQSSYESPTSLSSTIVRSLPGPSIRKRRNGLQPACEPCRKAKVRCDSSPLGSLCSRCMKRKTSSQCVFLEAPMTRQFHASSQPGLFLSTPYPPPRSRHGGSARGSYTTASTSTPPVSSGTRKVAGPPGLLGATSYSSTLSSGFLGLPSYSALLCGDSDIEVTNKVDQDPAQIALGINVFKLLPSHDDCQTLISHYLTHPGEVGFLKPSVQIILESLFSIYQPRLKDPRNDIKLEKISTDIIRNSEEILVLPDDAAGWMEAFSGPHTRWESVGIAFAALTYGLLALPEKGFGLLGLSLIYADKKKAILALKEAVEWCVELCKHSLNTLMCHLLSKNLLLETLIHGDSSLSVWRLHHDLVAVASAMGLHCYDGNPQNTLRSEMRKRLSACCFWSDKEIAMFTGRPPAWSHRYHSCPLPLDVSDDAIMEGGERLQNEIDSLDTNGWNTRGEVHDSTICRSMVLSASIVDEVMELFIGNSSQWSMERVRALKVKAVETYSQIPFILQLTKEDLIAFDSDAKMWKLMFIRLEYLRTQFLLERLSVERGNESKQKLVDVSREIMDMIVFLWVERDRSTHLQCDDYIIMCYGMPSTGILCTELLKQVRQPKEVEVRMPCSEVVQNLSLMIGFLEWIRPTAGNYKLCRRMAKVIRRVLDQVFESVGKESTKDSEVASIQDTTDDSLSFDDFDDFDWLNSIDWGHGPYLEMNSWS